MSFLWALLPNQMMQWIIRTTSLPQHFHHVTGTYWNATVLLSIVFYCHLRFVWLWGFSRFHEWTCHSTLGICLGGQKGRLFTHWLQPKWWLNILNIYYYTRTDPSAGTFFFCFYPLSPISYFFIYLFDIFWIEDPRTDVLYAFLAVYESTSRCWTSFLYPKKRPSMKRSSEVTTYLY